MANLVVLTLVNARDVTKTIAWGAISRHAPLHEDDCVCVYVFRFFAMFNLDETDVVATSFA